MDIKTLLGNTFKEGMSIDEINAALTDKNLIDPSTLPESVSKEMYNKTATEAANLRKQLKEKQTTDEQAAAQQKEIQDQMTALQKENSQMKLKESFITNGYDPKTASALATAYSEGDMTTFATLNAKFMEGTKTALQASIKEDLLKNTPGLQNAGDQNDPNVPSAGAAAAQAYNQQFVQQKE